MTPGVTTDNRGSSRTLIQQVTSHLGSSTAHRPVPYNDEAAGSSSVTPTIPNLISAFSRFRKLDAHHVGAITLDGDAQRWESASLPGNDSGWNPGQAWKGWRVVQPPEVTVALPPVDRAAPTAVQPRRGPRMLVATSPSPQPSWTTHQAQSSHVRVGEDL